jgi:hypothetical protein
VLDWPEFLGDGRKALARASEQLGLIWPFWHERALGEVDEFLSADLRHQRASEADLRAHPAISRLACETYVAMIELVRDPGDSGVLGKLDGLRADFERASAIFNSAMCELNEELRRMRAPVEIARADEDVRLIRSQATAEIARAEAISVAERDRERSCDSTRAASRSFWKLRSKASASRLADTKHLEVIRNSLFFNSQHYLEANRDVRAAGMDAALHYLVYGGREGRDPGPFFSTKAYLARYPDVAEAGLNALLHYEMQGRRENRVAGLERLQPAP